MSGRGPSALVVAVALAVLATAPAAGQGMPSARQPVVTGVDAIAITVSDLDRSIDFYSRILGFALLSETEVAGDAWEELEGVFGARIRIAALRLGDETILLEEYLAPRGRPIPPDARAVDRSFQHVAIVVREMDRAYRWLRDNRVEHASTGPQRLPAWNPNAGGIEAFYFRDPDGHFLELLAFPPDKGAAKWHRAGDDVFLGIDHTAIVVADTDASLRFYRDALGFRVTGASENWGREQEHLNNVHGAHLRITTLRAGAGPGIELLEYLTPTDGRPTPIDLRANDVAHWQTVLSTADATRAEAALRAARARFVSPGVIQVPRLPDTASGDAAVLLVRDADGHALELIAPAGPRASKETTR
ncbi:MAG TPA: VOC family protein [Candidatus Binatia bacterium]|nr:VOC family protein [Candidatus Binatia bacterium]